MSDFPKGGNVDSTRVWLDKKGFAGLFIEWEAEVSGSDDSDEEEEDEDETGDCDGFINDEPEAEVEDDIRIRADEKICDPDELANLEENVYDDNEADEMESEDEMEPEDNEVAPPKIAVPPKIAIPTKAATSNTGHHRKRSLKQVSEMTQVCF